MRDCERLRAFTSVSRIVWSRICRISWDFRDGGAPPTQGRSFERLTSVHERCTREHERLRVFTCVGWVVWSRICRIYWIFGMAGIPPAVVTLVRALDERFTSVAREIMSVCECLRVLGGIVWSRICRIYWDFRDDAGPAVTGALVRVVDAAFTSVARENMRDCERLRAFTRDSDRSSEGTGGTAGDFSVGLPTKAGQRGYFYEFFS